MIRITVRGLVCLALVGAMGAGAAAARGGKVQPSGYAYLSEELSLLDPGRTVLTDGDLTPLQGPKRFPHKGGVVFAFDPPACLDRIVIHSFKRTELAGFDFLRLSSIDHDGAETLIGAIEGYGYGAPAELRRKWANKDCVFEVDGPAAPVELLKIHGLGPHGFSFEEVEFYGIPKPPLERRAILPRDALDRACAALTAFDAEVEPEVDAPARPWAGTPPRVWVLIPKPNGAEIRELAARMDAHWTVPSTQPINYEQKITPQIAERILLGSLTESSPNVILLAARDWDKLPENVREAIRARVTAGTGLVVVDPIAGKDSKLWEMLPIKPAAEGKPQGYPPLTVADSDEGAGAFGRELVRLTDFSTFPRPQKVFPFAAKPEGKLLVLARQECPVLAAGRCGQGRVAVLNWNTRAPANAAGGLTDGVVCSHTAPLGNRFRPNAYYTAVCGALLWAANADFAATVENVKTSPDPAAGSVGVEVNTAGAVEQVEVCWRTDDERVGRTTASQAGQGWTARLTGLPCGALRLTVRLLSGGKVVGWHAVDLSLRPTVALGKLAPEAESFAPGGAVAAKVPVEDRGGLTEHTRLRASLRDAWGRLCARQHVPVAKAGEIQVSLPNRRSRSMWNTLEACVIDASGRRISNLARAIAPTYETRDDADFDDFPYLAWGCTARQGTKPHLLPRAMAGYRDAGITDVATYYTINDPVPFMAAAFRFHNINFFSGQAGMGPGFAPRDRKKEDQVRATCLNQQKLRDHVRNLFTRVADGNRRFSPHGYCLGDEAEIAHWYAPVDVCYCPECVAAFRKWLPTRYKDVDALNQQWGTEYASFEQAEPARVEEVRDRDNRSAWADFREFMDVNWADIYAGVRDILREKDPQARITISGPRPPAAVNGWDWSRFPGAFDYLLSYSHWDEMDDLCRCLMRKPFLPWVVGYGRRTDELRYFIYKAAFRGAQGISLFMAPLFNRADLSACEALVESGTVARPLLNGAGMALNAAEFVADPITLVYSHASVRAAYAQDLGNPVHYNDFGPETIRTVPHIIKEIGHQADWRDEKSLDLAGAKLAVLPLCLALSDANLAALEEFVKTGGCVLSVGPAGLWDEHCRKRTDDWFARVAGVKIGPVRVEAGEFPTPLDWGRLDLGLRARRRICRAEALDCEALARFTDGVPAVTLKRHGSGAFVYLCAGLMSNYKGYGPPHPIYFRNLSPHKEQADGLEAVFRKVAQTAGVQPRVRLAAGRQWPHAIEVTRRTLGPHARLISLQRLHQVAQGATPPREKVTVKLPYKAEAFEMLARERLGRTRKVRLTFESSSAFLLSLLPYRVRGLAMNVNETVAPGEELAVELQVVGPDSPGTHVFHVELRGADGRALPAYTRNLLASNGWAALRVPLALDEAPGTYTLYACDVLSPAETQTRIAVR